MSEISFIARANEHPKRMAIISEGKHYTYRHLLDESAKVACELLKGKTDLDGERIAVMMPPSFELIAAQWGIWRAGGIFVPLCLSHPAPALRYTLSDANVSFIIASEAYIELLQPLADGLQIKLLLYSEVDDEDDYQRLPSITLQRPAMILYTSGTTGMPKGVVITHGNIQAQVTNLCIAWRWHPDDHILSILPLHHVHGLINVVACALWSGAVCEFLPKFEPAMVWDKFCYGRINIFMAVPTVYVRLIAYWEQAPEKLQQKMAASMRKFRLMVSGSAALPISVMEQWAKITSHILLERYGMTEIGMAISNPYEGLRQPGHIGQALPGVHIRLVNEDGTPVAAGESGEIQVKGASVFKEYWNKPEATAKAFVDGWFQTGDIAIYENGSYRILGRNSVDIIKSGGYKISALEIEEALRAHPAIKDCGVVGIPDEEWGEIVVAALVKEEPFAEIPLAELRTWAKEHLPNYKVPQKIVYLEELPRNALGKLTKPQLKELLGNAE